jgi:hypothetical protein
LLNWAARYYPILRALRQHDLFSSGSILEIGSGPVGLGTFRKVPFTGCDLSFPVAPPWPMTPLVASAADLPLEDDSFDAVVASDVLEHIPPELRSTVISEALRVARKLVIFGFPCGAIAHDADRRLRDTYMRRNQPVPEWLEEHMLAPFPEPALFENLSGWNVVQFGNESISFHSWMMMQEFHRGFIYASRVAMRLTPRILEVLLRQFDGLPSYRQIFVISKASMTPPRTLP